MHQCVCVLSHVWLCSPVGYNPPGSSVRGIFLGKNTKVGCRFSLQRIFPTQRSNPHFLSLLHYRQILYHACHLGSSCQYDTVFLFAGFGFLFVLLAGILAVIVFVAVLGLLLLQSTGSVVVLHRFSCPATWGTFIFQTRDWTQVSYIGRWILNHWPPEKSQYCFNYREFIVFNISARETPHLPPRFSWIIPLVYVYR